MIKIFYSLILVTVLGTAALHAQNPTTPPPTQPPTQPPATQPSTQPRTQPQTQPGQTNSPSVQTPATTTPSTKQLPGAPPTGGVANPNTVIQQSPVTGVGATGGVAPAVLPAEPPPVAPNFQAPARPLPDASRVGVDVTNQLPMTLEEAITLALKNNNNIDISRNDVQVAEYTLRAARGVYDPLISSENY